MEKHRKADCFVACQFIKLQIKKNVSIVLFPLYLTALLIKSVSESSLSEEGESDLEENEKHDQIVEDTNTIDLDSYTVIPSHPKLMSSQEEAVQEEQEEEGKKSTEEQVSNKNFNSTQDGLIA